jgi:SAM-dependent methyltransferase
MSSALDRRRLIKADGTMAAALAGLRASAAQAATSGVAVQKDFELRGQREIFERLPDLNLESYHDFLRGFRVWSNGNGLAPLCEPRATEVLRANGIKVEPNVTLKLDEILPLLANDPIVTLYGRAWLDGQWYKFKTLQEAFHANADACFTEMEANDKVGPGKLELNPTMHIPDYTKHEIHTQLGGYVGDPLAGYIYLYDVLILNDGRDEQDASFINRANGVPAPADGKVKRVLDLGTGVGQLATSFQRRFPEAEVWGVEVGAPMIRYAHVRANDMGNKANFRQALAEDTGFPDGYFDIVASSAFYHEVTAEAAVEIFKEAHRVLRPGGVFSIEGSLAPPANEPWAMFRKYLDMRWNHEDWTMEWATLDKVTPMKKIGFKFDAPDPLKQGASTIARKA